MASGSCSAAPWIPPLLAPPSPLPSLACRCYSHPPPWTCSLEANRRLVSRFPELKGLVDDGTISALHPLPRDPDVQTGYRQPHLVILVGTSHMSRLSASQVGQVVRTVRPENVVVELCRSRAGLMYEIPASISKSSTGKLPMNLMSMTGQDFGAAISRSLQLGGQAAMGLRFILGAVSEKLSSVSGVTSGEEFRAARKASQEVGAQLVLGDRPIEITLLRAWEALGWFQKLKLVAVLFSGMNSPNLDMSEESLQVLRSDDALSTMFSYLSKEFPSLLQPLVHERDKYLAWSLTRSKAVEGSSIVVGVVGRGHMQGIINEILDGEADLYFSDLAGILETRNRTQNFFSNVILDVLIGLALWVAWNYVDSKTDITLYLLDLFQHNIQN